MKLKRTLGAIVLSAVLVLSFSSAVFAESNTTPQKIQEVGPNIVSKYVTVTQTYSLYSGYPVTYSYDDGQFQGTLTWISAINLGNNYVRVTYGGTVYIY